MESASISSLSRRKDGREHAALWKTARGGRLGVRNIGEALAVQKKERGDSVDAGLRSRQRSKDEEEVEKD